MNHDVQGASSALRAEHYPQCRFLRRALILMVTMIFLFGVAPGSSSEEDRSVWKALKSGNHFVIMRHAVAPGTGDPAHFKIGDCTTQRNLSKDGRKQSVDIGGRFRTNGIEKARVLSSQWCRCLETAKLLALGPVEPLPALNSFFQQFEREAQQTKQLKTWLDKQDLSKPIVLVTHQVNISAFVNVFPASGEMIVVRRSGAGAYGVVGRIQTEAGQE